MGNPKRQSDLFLGTDHNDNARATYIARIRERIDSTMIVRKLCDHIDDAERTPMTMTQIASARLLLDRTLPVLKPLEIKQEDGATAKSITNERLFALIEGQSKRVTHES
jgi:hypothetical protein